MALKHALTTLTEEEYLAGEEISEIKHEYIDGKRSLKHVLVLFGRV